MDRKKSNSIPGTVLSAQDGHLLTSSGVVSLDPLLGRLGFFFVLAIVVSLLTIFFCRRWSTYWDCSVNWYVTEMHIIIVLLYILMFFRGRFQRTSFKSFAKIFPCGRPGLQTFHTNCQSRCESFKYSKYLLNSKLRFVVLHIAVHIASVYENLRIFVANDDSFKIYSAFFQFNQKLLQN